MNKSGPQSSPAPAALPPQGGGSAWLSAGLPAPPSDATLPYPLHSHGAASMGASSPGGQMQPPIYVSFALQWPVPRGVVSGKLVTESLLSLSNKTLTHLTDTGGSCISDGGAQVRSCSILAV